MTGKGRSENIQLVDVFECLAIPGPGLENLSPNGKGENEGISIRDELTVELLPTLPATAAVPDARFGQTDELAGRVFQVFLSLPSTDSAVLMLRSSGMSEAEISTRLGISLPHVSDCLNRVRQQFQNQLPEPKG